MRPSLRGILIRGLSVVILAAMAQFWFFGRELIPTCPATSTDEGAVRLRLSPILTSPRTTAYKAALDGRLFALDRVRETWRQVSLLGDEPHQEWPLRLDGLETLPRGESPLLDFGVCASRLVILANPARRRLFTFDLASGRGESDFAFAGGVGSKLATTGLCSVIIAGKKADRPFEEFSLGGTLLASFGELKPIEESRLDWTELANLSLQSAVIVPFDGDLFVTLPHLPVIQRYDAQRRLLFQRKVKAPPVSRILDQFLENGGSCDGARHRSWGTPVPIITRAAARLDRRIFLLVSNELVEMNEYGSVQGIWAAPTGVVLNDLISLGDRLAVNTPSGLHRIENIGRSGSGS